MMLVYVLRLVVHHCKQLNHPFILSIQITSADAEEGWLFSFPNFKNSIYRRMFHMFHDVETDNFVYITCDS